MIESARCISIGQLVTAFCWPIYILTVVEETTDSRMAGEVKSKFFCFDASATVGVGVHFGVGRLTVTVALPASLSATHMYIPNCGGWNPFSPIPLVCIRGGRWKYSVAESSSRMASDIPGRPSSSESGSTAAETVTTGVDDRGTFDPDWTLADAAGLYLVARPDGWIQ